jgi:hypothetical protein
MEHMYAPKAAAQHQRIKNNRFRICHARCLPCVIVILVGINAIWTIELK